MKDPSTTQPCIWPCSTALRQSCPKPKGSTPETGLAAMMNNSVIRLSVASTLSLYHLHMCLPMCVYKNMYVHTDTDRHTHTHPMFTWTCDCLCVYIYIYIYLFLSFSLIYTLTVTCELIGRYFHEQSCSGCNRTHWGRHVSWLKDLDLKLGWSTRALCSQQAVGVGRIYSFSFEQSKGSLDLDPTTIGKRYSTLRQPPKKKL